MDTLEESQAKGIPRRVFGRCPPGRRGRGRPRNTFMQEIMTGMKIKGLEEEDWNDRDEWRRKIKL